jgi:hypothetical protein
MTLIVIIAVAWCTVAILALGMCRAAAEGDEMVAAGMAEEAAKLRRRDRRTRSAQARTRGRLVPHSS